MRLNKPLPRAWNTELSTMLVPASKKCRQMIRMAGMPMVSMAWLAENRPSTWPGKNSKMQKPSTMIPSA